MFTKTTQNVHMYTLLDTYNDCDLLHDRSVLSIGRTPTDKQNNCLDHNQIWSRVQSPKRAQRQRGL